jgi:hypothetical protein
MNEKETNRMLALLVFVSSSISAFSLGALAYTFATGDLPFGLHSLAQEKGIADEKAIAANKCAKARAPTENSDSLRVDEEFLSAFAAELKKEKEKIAEERKVIEVQRKNADLIMKDATAMQGKVEAKEKEVNDLIKKVDSKERSNVTDLQKLIVGMETAQGLKMLLSLDETLAARILYSMNKKVASKLVESAMGGKEKESAEKIKRITARMQTLSDELKGDLAK